ncbi:MAG: hypothetical protein ACOY3C_00915 [Bacillota bacterium]
MAYLVASLAAGSPQKAEWAAETYLGEIRKKLPEIEPIDARVFPGVIDFTKLPFLLRPILRAAARQLGLPTKGRFDPRDMEAVRAWGRELLDRLG